MTPAWACCFRYSWNWVTMLRCCLFRSMATSTFFGTVGSWISVENVAGQCQAYALRTFPDSGINYSPQGARQQRTRANAGLPRFPCRSFWGGLRGLPHSILFGFPFRFLRPKLQVPLSSSAFAVQFLFPFDPLVLAHDTSLEYANTEIGAPSPYSPSSFFRSTFLCRLMMPPIFPG